MSKLRGLPETKRMRHDFHFVEQLLSTKPSPVGRMIDILLLDPSPGQPRKDFGDLSDLVSSIKERGVLEPILVRQLENRYQIIAGERRYRASLEAGLTRVPCVVLDVDDRGVLEISLIENLQRRDLDPFEEADGIQNLVGTLGLTHEEAARRLGRSRTALTESVTLARIPAPVRERCLRRGQMARSLLLQLARQKDETAMLHLLDKVEAGNLGRQDLRELRKKDAPRRPGRPTGFTFKYQAPDKAFRLQIRFGRANVEKSELIRTLQEILHSLQQN